MGSFPVVVAGEFIWAGVAALRSAAVLPSCESNPGKEAHASYTRKQHCDSLDRMKPQAHQAQMKQILMCSVHQAAF